MTREVKTKEEFIEKHACVGGKYSEELRTDLDAVIAAETEKLQDRLNRATSHIETLSFEMDAKLGFPRTERETMWADKLHRANQELSLVLAWAQDAAKFLTDWRGEYESRLDAEDFDPLLSRARELGLVK